MRFAIFGVVVALSACAPALVGANETGGLVNANFNMSQDKAIALADAHCRKFGKVAHVVGQNEIRNSVRFDCVKPS